ASAHGAHLTALYIVGERTVPTSLLGLLPPAALESYRRERRARAQAATERFRERAERDGLSVETRIEESDEAEVAQILSVHARYCDLAVLGQPDPEDPQVGGRSLPDHVVLTCGRPVLVVPYIGPARTLGERVMVAWNAGRESARAANDALPILARAK